MAASLLEWYADVGAKYLDLVGDYAGKEKFFIEGDSLLLECFSDGLLDLQPGFQLLHSVYLVERYLYNLLKRGCNFDVIFFDSHKGICIPPIATSTDASRYLLARTIVIKHLRETTLSAGTASHCFESLNDPAFAEYLHDSACYFALCSDGATYKIKSRSLHLQSHAVSDGIDSKSAQERRVQLRSVIHNLLHRKSLDVALLNGLSLQDSKVFAFVLERSAQHDGLTVTLPISVSHGLPAETRQERLGKILHQARGILSGASSQHTARLMTTTAALSEVSSEFSRFTSPMILHTMVLQSVKLSDRQVPAVSFAHADEQRFRAFLDQFCSEANNCMAADLPSIPHDSTMIDLVDGRVFRQVLADPAKYGFLLSTKQQEVAELLTQLLCASPPPSEALQQVPHEVLHPAKKQASGTVLPFDHPAFDKHLACIKVQVNGDAEQYSGRLALELTHWHNTKKLEESHRAKQEQQNKPRWLIDREKARELRPHQRFMARQTSYAISLSGGHELNPKLILVDKPGKQSNKKARKTKKDTSKQTGASRPEKIGRGRPPKLAEDPGEAVRVNADPVEEGVLLSRLLNEGPHFDRSVDARTDDRVSFKPDAWQVRVLDELDQGNSLLVVAPTSAGKTFISFYAMEQVLRADDDGVLVYVAPTKALVNQIAAEVQAKFRKPQLSAGRSLWSIFTRDYRVNEPKKAQILVTVPHMLQIMLMSASNKDWVPKIKSIIFDEVHSVANADDGLVWEQLLMAAPCRIIALSATIGNTTEFARWLTAAQAKLGRTCTLVQHDHRYSDLRKYLFQPHINTVAGGLPTVSRAAEVVGLDELKTMNHVHPASCLLHRQRGVPDDLALESADCLRLWQTMIKHQTVDHFVPASLNPTVFFHGTTIAKADITSWGGDLKAVLAGWMESQFSPFELVLNDLKEKLSAELVEKDLKPNTILEERDVLLASTIPLLCELRANNALPAILFNFNRGACETIARTILDTLTTAEAQFKFDSTAFRKKVERYEYWQKTAATRQKQKNAAKKDKKAVDRDEVGGASQARAAAEDKEESWDTFNPEAPLDRFSFADIKKNDSQMIEDLFKQLRWAKVPEYLMECFQRGIGVHHSGLNKWYRQAVEMFFRKGFLTVVVATGTLSLGINMPCKTVVFSGDSVFLTALNYRQASGRAGRRGFDLLGNVVFQNIPTSKVLRLMSSRLPDINGHFPMTTLFVLRLLALLQGTDNAPYAMAMVDSLLSQPRLFLGGEEFRHQVLHHIRFSIEYLRSQELINGAGQPIGFANCVSHLYYVENNALAFHALLKEGYFHRLAESYTSNKIETLRKLMIVLAHLFGRRVMRPSELEAATTRNSISRVVLPDLPDDAATILREHNQQTLRTYTTYVSTFIDQHCKGEDMAMPFTGTTLCCNAAAVELPEKAAQPKMRSPFIALSGHGDDFGSVSELCDSVRGGVFLEKAVIPYLDMADEMETPLNAYLYDFYISGSTKTLIEANKIPRGDVWFLLKDFTLVLATVITSFDNYLNGSNVGDDVLIDDAMSNDGESVSGDLDRTEGKPNPSSSIDVQSDRHTASDDINLSSNSARSSATDLATHQFSLVQLGEAKKAIHSSQIKEVSPQSTLPIHKQKAKAVDSWEDESDDDNSESEVVEDISSDGTGPDSNEAMRKTERELRKVCNMFKDLQEEFEQMFRKTWA